MVNNRQKEDWIDSVMNSTQGMARADAQAGLYERVASGVNKPVSVIAMPVKQWAAAAILLLALNIGSVVYFTNRNKTATQPNTISGLTAEMQLESTYNY